MNGQIYSLYYCQGITINESCEAKTLHQNNSLNFFR